MSVRGMDLLYGVQNATVQKLRYFAYFNECGQPGDVAIDRALVFAIRYH